MNVLLAILLILAAISALGVVFSTQTLYSALSLVLTVGLLAVLGSPVKVPVGTLDEGRLGIGADPIEIRKSRESLCRRRNRPRTEQKGRAEPLHPANSAHIILLAALIFGHVDYT